MPRALSFLISVAILATAAYLSWRLMFPERKVPPAPPIAGPEHPASRPDSGTPETRATGAGPAVVVEAPAPEAPDRIEGVVYDDAGKALGDADVQIIEQVYSHTSTRPPDRRFEERVIASTATGDDGKFNFAGLVPGHLKTLRASKPGFIAQLKGMIKVPKTVEFHLMTGVPVSGVVVSETTGKPIEGVGIKGWFGNAAGGPRDFLWKEEVFTNAAGEFTFEGVPAGKVLFMLAHPDHLDLSEEVDIPGPPRLSFRMKPGLVIEGIVRHAIKGTPAAGLAVEVKDTNPMFPRWQTRTDDEGVFRMKGVRPGKVHFEISGRGFTPLAELVDLSGANDFADGGKGARVEFKVQPAGRASGRVLSSKGEPVSRARIFVATVQGLFIVVRDPKLHGGSMADGEIRTDEKGTFLVDDLIARPHRLVVEAPGFGMTTSPPIEVGPDQIKDGVEIVVNPSPAIRGSVTDENRIPIANAMITVELPQYADVWFPPGFDLGQKAQRTLVTDETGLYRVEVPYPGKFTVRVDHPDFVLVDGTSVTIKETELGATQDFTLKKAFSISGSVIGPSGRAEPGVVVRAWREGGPPDAFQGTTDSAGVYNLVRLEGGFYRMNARKPDANLTSEYRDEVSAGSAGVDFALVTGGEISGAVTDSSGAPVQDFQVSLRPVGQRFMDRGRERKKPLGGLTDREETRKDSGGAFKIERVEPGVWTLQVFSELHAASAPVDVTVRGGVPASVGTIELPVGGTVSGRITTTAGAPIEDVEIELNRIGELPGVEPSPTRAASQRQKTARTGAGGEYTVRGLIAGEYLLRVQSARYVDPPHDRFVVQDGAVVDRSFKLRVASSLTVSIKDEVGEATPSVYVQVVDAAKAKVFAQTDGGRGDTTDASGRLTLKKLPAGEDLTLRLIRAGFEVEEVPQKLKEGDNGVVEVRIRRYH